MCFQWLDMISVPFCNLYGIQALITVYKQLMLVQVFFTYIHKYLCKPNEVTMFLGLPTTHNHGCYATVRSYQFTLLLGQPTFQGGLIGRLKTTVKLTIISLRLQLPILGFCTILNWDPVSKATPFAERKGLVTLQLTSCQWGTYIAVR